MSIFKRICLLLLLLPTLSLALLPYIPAEVAACLTFLPLALIPLVLLNACLAAVLFVRHSRWRWMFAAAFLYGGWQLSETFSFSTSVRPVKPDTFPVRIISWNVQDFHLNADTLRHSAKVLLSQQPDILCFQERPHTNLLAWDTIRTVFSAYPYTMINSREDEVLNLAVFSRWPILDRKEFYFPNSYNKFMQVDIHTGNRIIRLFNVHLQTTGMTPELKETSIWQRMVGNAGMRNMQADTLHKAIASSPYPVIVCGDFNDVPSSYAYAQVSRGLKDCFKEAGHGWGGSYQALGSLFRIDHMLCSEEAEVIRYTLTDNPWSDHKIQSGTLCFSPDKPE